ncbi:Signal transduction histidine kinase [Synechocystis sp. PCC 6803]|nr:Signal transduction histidine kinase [Synechocystis sp. PCC 6803] [Bacillus subtilis BEST7613]
MEIISSVKLGLPSKWARLTIIVVIHWVDLPSIRVIWLIVDEKWEGVIHRYLPS